MAFTPSNCKTETVDKKLDKKAGIEFTAKRLDHTENMIDKILVTIDELWYILRNRKESLCPTENNGAATELDNSDNPPNNNVAAPGNIRQAPLRPLVPIEEDQLNENSLSRSKSFSLGEHNQPNSENSVYPRLRAQGLQ